MPTTFRILRLAVAIALTVQTLACGRSGLGDAGQRPPLSSGDTATTAPDAALGLVTHDAAWVTTVDVTQELPVPDARTVADLVAPWQPFRLSEQEGTRLQVVSDSEGNAVVLWVTGETARSVRWTAARATWTELETMAVSDPILLDPHGSSYPAIVWGITTSRDTASIRRYDPEGGNWGPALVLPGPFGGWDWSVSVDGRGNTHTFWQDAQGRSSWSLWPARSSGWLPTMPLDEFYWLVAAPANAFIWHERNAFAVRRFDVANQAWSSPVQLLVPAWQSGLILQTHRLEAGPDGAALALTVRRDPTQVAVEARRYDPMTDVWGDIETVALVPTDTDPSVLPSLAGGLSHPVQDWAWVLTSSTDKAYTLQVVRRDPGRQAWELSRTLATSYLRDYPKALSADGAGRLYGALAGVGLVRFDPSRASWQDTPTDGGAFIVKTTAEGAFAVGWNNGSRLVALASRRGAEWEPVRGFPTNAEATVGSVPFTMVTTGAARALVVWTGTNDGERGIWAAFLD